MATVYGSNATLRDNSTPSKKIPASDQGGRVRVAYDEYNMNGAGLTAGDVIKLMKLPSGARVQAVVLSCPALTAGAVNLGWEANGVDAASAAGFLSAQTLASAARVTLPAGAAGDFFQFGADTQISAVVTTTITGTSGKIKVAVLYSLD